MSEGIILNDVTCYEKGDNYQLRPAGNIPEGTRLHLLGKAQLTASPAGFRPFRPVKTTAGERWVLAETVQEV